ncbi:MAG TPA: VOC family protein [Myxococcales bacterium]|jgi:predicted enzyme related to lactoylglutathione lyase|nr:VOC family protein [Myxococcales bacterium]
MAAKRSIKRSTTKKTAARGAKKAVAKKGKAVKAAAAKRAKPAAPRKAPAKRPAAKKIAAPKVAAKAPKASKAAAPTRSRFVWVDLMTSDVASAQSFYKTLFGWGTKDVDVAPPMNKYTMFNTGGQEFGGVLPKQDPNTPTSWLPYVLVDDVDKVTTRAAELGGKVLMPAMDIPDVGRFSVIMDPTGGVLSPMSFVQEPRPAPPAGLYGPVAWCELFTDDVNKAGAFYSDLFGWTRTAGPTDKYVVFKRGDRDAGGLGTRPPGSPPAMWVTYFFTQDVDVTHTNAMGKGAKEVVPPSDIPNVGRFSWLADPQGAIFALFNPKGMPPPSA